MRRGDPKAARGDPKTAWRGPDSRRQSDQASAAERRLAQVAQMRALQEQKAAEKSADAERAAGASAQRAAFVRELEGLSLWAEDGTRGRATPAYRELAKALYDVRTQARSKAILAWPTGNISLAACHALSCLAFPRTSPVVLTPDRRRAPAPTLRALFFPYSGRARLPLRRVYADRDGVSAVSIDHIADPGRRNGPGYAYFSRLCRAKDLNGTVRGGGYHFEYEHPTLDEVVSVVGLGAAKDSDVLGRIAHRTDLKHLSNQPGDPSESPYVIFGLPATDRLKPSDRRAENLDLILLDLTRAGRNRLGRDWQRDVASALEAATRAYGKLPVLAVTDDTYVHSVLAWDILKKHDGVSGKAPAGYDAILGLTAAIVGVEDPAPPNLSTVREFEALGCADPDASLLSDLARAIERARTTGDAEAADLLDEMASVVRRTAALPGGIDALGAFVADNEGVQAAAQRMAGYSLDRLLKTGEDLAGPFAQQRHSDLVSLLARAKAWVTARETGSPIGLMLRSLVLKGLNGSTRKIVWSQTSAISEFAEHSLTTDSEIGSRISQRIASNMITFMDALAFREIEALPRVELAGTKRMLVVSPRRSQALALLTQPWLPETITLIADERTMLGAGRDAGRLAEFPAFAIYADRLKRLSVAALSEAKRIRGHALDLTFSAPMEDVDFPEGGVIDLAGRRAPGEKVVRIVTEDRRTILARRKTRLITYDSDGPVPTFSSCNAEDVAKGDRLCVIDQAFVDMARARLDIRAAAAEEIRDYHDRVQAQFLLLEGDMPTQKLRTLIQRMGEPFVLEGTARTWTHLAAEVEKPLDLVLPRAPQERATFDRFMRALSVPAPLAASYWAWAVILTRKARIRAAQRLHEAYLAILVDTFTAEHVSPARRADIRSLRATAEGHVSSVVTMAVETVTDQ